MAISETQKVDYLWKKLAYGLSKTDTNANKRATNESIASPLLLSGENVWSQSNLIPATIPGSSSGVVTVYPTSSPDETTADTSATTNRTWKTGLTDWISPEFGSTYLVKVYIHTAGQSGSAASSGTQVFGAGSGNDDEWFFDYQSGILHFIGTNLPSGISGKSVYVSGARYTGIKGVAVPGAGATFTTLSVSGLSTFNDGLSISGIVSVTNTTENTLGDADTGAVQIDGGLGVNGNTTVGGGISVTSDSHFTGEVHIGPDSHLSLSHDSGVTNHSRIKDAGLGDLVFESNGNFVFVDGAANLKAQFNSGVELYEGNEKKFQVVGSGVSIFDSLSSDATINGPGRLVIKPDFDDNNTGLLVIDGDLNVSGVVTGITTFSSNVDINASVDILTNLDVHGQTDLDEVNIDGDLYITDGINVSGISTFQSFVYLPDYVYLNFGNNQDLQIYHDSDDSYIRDVGTGNLNIDSVDGSINIRVASNESAIIAKKNAAVELYHDNSLKFETTGIGVSVSNGGNDTATITGPTNLIIDPAVVGDDTGVVRIKGDLYVDGTTTQINSSTIQLADFIVGIATTATSNALADGAGIEIGPSNINFKYYYNSNTNPSLKSSENLNIALNKVYQINQVEVLSSTTLGSGVVNSSLTNVGTLTELNVSGISTFSSLVDINAGLDVDGFTELDSTNISETLSVSGLSTFASNVDVNANLDVDGFAELDSTNISETLSVSGLSTFSSNVDVNASVDISTNLTVDGLSDLDELNVAGLSTFASNVDINADLDVDGLSNLDELNVAGLSTFASNVDVNANLDVDGFTELDSTNISETLSVSGISTFSSLVDINAGLDVDGFTELDSTNISETLSVSGLSTFSSNVDINAGLDVDGFTELDSTNISETLSVSGLSTFSSNVDINASVDINNDLTVHGDIDIDTITTTSAVTATLSTTTETAVHSGLSTTAYRSVEYTIQVTEGTNYHSTKILAVHDGTTAYHSEYGTVYTNSSVATFDVDLNGGNIRLLATGSTSNSTVYKIYFTATKL